MKKKTLLIFGGGINQLTLIKATKDLGVQSIVIDPSDSAPGKDFADIFYVVQPNDFLTTKEIILKHKADALITSQMQNPLRMMAKLADDLGLAFMSREVIETSLDKNLMKSAFYKKMVPCAKGFCVDLNTFISKENLRELNFPLIIKPKEAHSSQGVFKVENLNEIEKYKNLTASFSKSGEIIIEEFLDGPEFSVESITFNTKTTIVQITEKFVTPFPRTVEMGHLQPTQLSSEQKEKISKVVVSAIDAIGINNSAAHTEVKLTTEGPKIVEIGARLGGDYISSYLTLHSCGVNMDKAAIQVALGQEPELTPTLNQFSYIKYLELPLGNRVKEVNNWQDILDYEDVVFANIAVRPGDVIEEITESKKRPGFVIVKGNARTEVITQAKYYEVELIRKIVLE